MPAKQQVLVTKQDFSADKYRLVELNADVEAAIKAGDKVFIVGAPSEKAVLCTSTKSFYLTKEDTSNLRLLTEHSKWEPRQAGDDKSAATVNTAERDEIVVRGSALFHYLSSSTPQKRAKLNKLYTTDDLVSALQCSKQEVLDMLVQLYAFEDAGTWRLLSTSYQSTVFSDILDIIIQNDLDFLASHGIPITKFQEETDHPLVAIRQCCKIYGAVLTGKNGEESCTFEPAKIAGFCAKQLFEEQIAESQRVGGRINTSEGWVLDQFMDKWALRVPEKVRVDAEMLRGVGLVKAQKGKPTRIVYFPEENLPLGAKQRFEKLFQAQEKWTIQQLEPFIQSLVVPGTTQAALLLKHTRSSRQINSTERLYSKR
uniref:Sister chromatid cohesion protein DCC1 n=1 Tax=Globisporangium ultimum (strain ATCC 200006 / CBS 805.95 / DAOM BR144) TaxID=431595 RepID=K3WIX1_GLOUD